MFTRTKFWMRPSTVAQCYRARGIASRLPEYEFGGHASVDEFPFLPSRFRRGRSTGLGDRSSRLRVIVILFHLIDLSFDKQRVFGRVGLQLSRSLVLREI